MSCAIGLCGGTQAYNTRHFTRVDRLLRATFLVDLTLAALTGLTANDHADVAPPVAARGVPSTSLQLQQLDDEVGHPPPLTKLTKQTLFSTLV
jgi:hypothetical protein